MACGVLPAFRRSREGGRPDARVLPLGPFFDGIAARPTAPWWVYALLFSTMIPSLINLMIGGASLMRGVPGVPSLLLRFMPIGKAMPVFDRTWMAIVLALQVVGGVILGVFAQALAVVIVIGYLTPRLGLGLLDMARDCCGPGPAGAGGACFGWPVVTPLPATAKT